MPHRRAGARHVTDEMFLTAAKTLSQKVLDEEFNKGSLYPSLKRIREVSADIAEAVAEIAFERGLAVVERPDDLSGYIKSLMYEAVYPKYV